MMDEGEQNDLLEARFPHRVAIRRTPRGSDVEVRTWCAERLGTPQHDVYVRPVESTALWAYRYEFDGIEAGDATIGDIVRYVDAFYFHNENAALEFKLRWG